MEYMEYIKLVSEAKVKKIRQMMEEGEIEVPLSFWPGREKVSGRMYEGKLCVLYKGVKAWFHMFTHHQSNEPMTEDEALKHMTMDGAEIDGQYYDLYWHSKRLGGQFFFHKEGWFGLKEENMELKNHYLVQAGDGHCNPITEDERLELERLGFIRIPDLDYVYGG